MSRDNAMAATERPIIFGGEMIRALLAGRKTETRRLVKPRHRTCPYGEPGDRLWVRETWRPESQLGGRMIRYAASCGPIDEMAVSFHARPAFDALALDRQAGRWRPSIHLPRWASRLTLEVTATRRERLRCVDGDGARREGVADRVAYLRLWNEINGAGSWESDPEVWVITFRRVTP